MGNQSSQARGDPNSVAVSYTIRGFVMTGRAGFPKKLEGRLDQSVFNECSNVLANAVRDTDPERRELIEKLNRQFLWIFFCGFFGFILGIGFTLGGFLGGFLGEKTNGGLVFLGVIGVLLICIGFGSFMYAAISIQERAKTENTIWFNSLENKVKELCGIINQRSLNTMIWNASVSTSLIGGQNGQNQGNGTVKMFIKLQANRVQVPPGFLNGINLNNGSQTNVPVRTGLKPIPPQNGQQPMQPQIQYQQPMQQQPIQQQPVSQSPMQYYQPPIQPQYQQPNQQQQVPQGQIMMVQMPNGQMQQVMVVPQNMQQNMPQNVQQNMNVPHDGEGQ